MHQEDGVREIGGGGGRERTGEEKGENEIERRGWKCERILG